MNRKTISAMLASVLAVCILAQGLAVPAGAATTYTGSLMTVVNTDLSTGSQKEGTFSSTGTTSSVNAQEQNISGTEEAGVFDVYTDSNTGETLTVLEPDLADPEPVAICDAEDVPQKDVQPLGYAVDATKTIVSSGDSLFNVSMQCLYVGTHCTVWGSTSDNTKIQINKTQAADIGQEFDGKFKDISNAFGDYWYDADSDGKVAILCYDLDQDYGTEVSSYTAGYFWMRDMIDANGYIQNANYGSEYYINGMDCIHIDTYPGMGYGSGRELAWVEDCYSTLMHEFQHMINFSYVVKNYYDISQMPTFMNEAFSMASQHMLCGYSSVSGRVSYFNNSSSYTPGTSLTYWGGTLSNYSNSYLFGQYIRTRYAQMGYDGNSIYKAVFQSQVSGDDDAFQNLAELLGTTKLQLVKDFWQAVALRQPAGPYGFFGESWADNISPQQSSFSTGSVLSYLATSESGIYSGGAKFYTLSSGSCSIKKSTNVAFLMANSDKYTSARPTASNAQVVRTGKNSARLTFTSDKAGFVRYRSSAGYSYTGYNQLTPNLAETQTMTANSVCTVDFTFTPEKGKTQMVTFYVASAAGEPNVLQALTIPDYTPGLTVSCGANGTLTVKNGATAYESGTQVPWATTLTVTATPAQGYKLDTLTVNGTDLENGGRFDIDGDTTVAATFVPAYVLTLVQPENGTISVGNPYVNAGDTVNVTVTPNTAGSKVYIFVDGVLLSGTSFTATGDHTISAVIVEETASGSLNGGGTWSVSADDRIYFCIDRASAGYLAAAVYENGSERVRGVVYFPLQQGSNFLTADLSGYGIENLKLRFFVMSSSCTPETAAQTVTTAQ